MIPISVMVTGRGTTSFRLKGEFGLGRPSRFSSTMRPVITWNITNRCNLRCSHCYMDAGSGYGSELKDVETICVVERIVELNPPLVILSGGEPLVRENLFEIASMIRSHGIKLALSTNGTLIDREVAKKLRKTGFVYVGVSIDSPDERWNDEFRGVSGAFRSAIRGAKNCVREGVPVGLRLTLTEKNWKEAPAVVRLAREIGAERVTFYHLSAVGRARKLSRRWYLTPKSYFRLMNKLIELARKYTGEMEIETTLGPFDGIYVAWKLSNNEKEFRSFLELIGSQGGCGRRMISIYPDGSVHPCQFVDFMTLGNVLEEPLSSMLSRMNPIFTNPAPLLRGPKCSGCSFKEFCGGGDRVRAFYLTGDLYGDDPQCFLPVNEISSRYRFQQ